MLRIATFNLENLDEDRFEDGRLVPPGFDTRAAILRPALERLRADILCLQEVHGQERPDAPRDLHTLRALIAPTRYATYRIVSTRLADGSQVYDKRNLVTLVRPDIAIEDARQINGDVVDHPRYQRRIAGDDAPRSIGWERPLQHVTLRLPGGLQLHVMNVHFKSKNAVAHAGSMQNWYTWNSSAAWAEGYFVSAMKRVGAALEARAVIDEIFDADPDAAIVILGDFNADPDEVPVMALRGRVEETGNGALTGRVMVPLAENVAPSARFSLIHRGKGELIDHILSSRRMVQAFVATEIHNEGLQDESIRYASDAKFPASDHAPVVSAFDPALLGVPVA